MAFGIRKKTSERLRTLTEKEIQEKLYGKFRKPLDFDAAFPVRDSNTLVVEEVDESENHLPPPLVTPLPSAHLAVKKMTFLENQLKDIKPEGIKPVFERRDKGKEGSLGIENFRTSLKMQKPQNSYSYRQHTTRAVSLMQSLGKSLLQAVAIFIQGVLKVLQWFNVGRFRNRAVVYWVGSILFLVFLLGGIHYLNVKRETAMKMPRHRIVAGTSATSKSPGASQHTHSAVKRIAVPAAGPLSKVETTGSNEPNPVVSDNPEESNSGGLFVIQIATYASESDAHELLKQIREEQLPCFIKELTRLGGKVYSTVFIGRFKSYQQAQAALVKFQKKDVAKPFQDAFIRTLKLSSE